MSKVANFSYPTCIWCQYWGNIVIIIVIAIVISIIIIIIIFIFGPSRKSSEERN